MKSRLAFVLFLLLAAALPARAADAALDFYEKQAKTVLKAAGQKVWETADDARKSGFHALATREAERAIGFDPEHDEARKYLCYTKRDGKWVQDEAEFKKVPRENQRDTKEPIAAYDKRVQKWEEESLKRADKYVAARYAELGELCAAKGYTEQAQKGFESALRLDRDNEKARRGLGYTRFGKVWLTKKQDEARKAASKSEVVKEAGKDPWEELLGLTLNKVQSAHFRIESAYDVAELQLYCEALETAYAYYLADFDRDPGHDEFEGRRYAMLVLKTEPEWDRIVDTYVATDREWIRKMGGRAIGALEQAVHSGPGSTADSRKDYMVHVLVHTLNHRVWKLRGHAWLDEGLAYYYSLKVLETCLTHCLDKKDSTYAKNSPEGGDKDWGNSDGWKPLLKELVVKKNDTPLRTVTMQPLTKLDFVDTVKSWSVASWLMDRDRDKFTSVLEQMLDPAVKQENVLQGTYGKGLEELDDDWHAFVKRCY